MSFTSISQISRDPFHFTITVSLRKILITVKMCRNDHFCRNLYAIPGLDYVAHEDILPYSTQVRNHDTAGAGFNELEKSR